MLSGHKDAACGDFEVPTVKSQLVSSTAPSPGDPQCCFCARSPCLSPCQSLSPCLGEQSSDLYVLVCNIRRKGAHVRLCLSSQVPTSQRFCPICWCSLQEERARGAGRLLLSPSKFVLLLCCRRDSSRAWGYSWLSKTFTSAGTNCLLGGDSPLLALGAILREGACRGSGVSVLVPVLPRSSCGPRR